MGGKAIPLCEPSEIDVSKEARSVMRELRPKPETLASMQLRHRIAISFVAQGMNGYIVD